MRCNTPHPDGFTPAAFQTSVFPGLLPPAALRRLLSSCLDTEQHACHPRKPTTFLPHAVPLLCAMFAKGIPQKALMHPLADGVNRARIVLPRGTLTVFHKKKLTNSNATQPTSPFVTSCHSHSRRPPTKSLHRDGILKRKRRVLHCIHQLLRHCARNQSVNDVPRHDSSNSPIGLAQRCQTTHENWGLNLLRHLPSRQTLRHLEEQPKVFRMVE